MFLCFRPQCVLRPKFLAWMIANLFFFYNILICILLSQALWDKRNSEKRAVNNCKIIAKNLFMYLRNAENCVTLRVDGVLAVQFKWSSIVIGQGSTFTKPFNCRSRLATKPQVITNWSTLFQCEVVNSITDDMRWHCNQFVKKNILNSRKFTNIYLFKKLSFWITVQSSL